MSLRWIAGLKLQSKSSSVLRPRKSAALVRRSIIRCWRTLISSWQISSRNSAWPNRLATASCRRTSSVCSRPERRGCFRGFSSVLIDSFGLRVKTIRRQCLISIQRPDQGMGFEELQLRRGPGPFTLIRFFPPWFWKAMNAPYHVTQGLGYHFFFMWLFAINGILYVLFTVLSGEWRFVVPDRKSLKEAIQVTLKDLHLSNYLPPQTKYNGAQKIAYTSVILMGAGSLITGLSIYKPTQVHWITTLLGGYEMARWEHFLLTMGFCGFFLIHVTQVILAGWNNFRSMVSGLEVKPIQEPSLEAERKSWG